MKYKVRESKIFRLRKERLEEGVMTVLKYLKDWNIKKGLDLTQIKLGKADFNLRNEIYQWKSCLKKVHALQQKHNNYLKN